MRHWVKVTQNDGTTIAVTIGDDYEADVKAAVEREHPNCDSTACDISAALENGFPLVAAFLLGGATETPILDAVVKAHEENGTAAGPNVGGFPDGWDDWCEWHKENGIQCESCNAYTFAEPGSQCGNCLAILPSTTDDGLLEQWEQDATALPWEQDEPTEE